LVGDSAACASRASIHASAIFAPADKSEAVADLEDFVDFVDFADDLGVDFVLARFGVTGSALISASLSLRLREDLGVVESSLAGMS